MFVLLQWTRDFVKTFGQWLTDVWFWTHFTYHICWRSANVQVLLNTTLLCSQLFSSTGFNYLFLFSRLRPSWSTSLEGLSTVQSSPTASPKPVESWSSRCRWWSGWKVGMIKHTQRNVGLVCLTLLVSKPPLTLTQCASSPQKHGPLISILPGMKGSWP